MKLRTFLKSLTAFFGLGTVGIAAPKLEPYPFDPRFKTYGDFNLWQTSQLDDDWKCVMKATMSSEAQNHIYGFCAERGCLICLRDLEFMSKPQKLVVFKPEAVEAAKRILKACY